MVHYCFRFRVPAVAWKPCKEIFLKEFSMQVALKRAYEQAADSDGMRILVDRLWPRGIKKENAKIDLWLKEVAPSTELRKWFNHQDERWAEFQRRYLKELKNNPALVELQALAAAGKVTLIFSTKDEKKNSAVVLQRLLLQPE